MVASQTEFDWTRRHVRNGNPATSIHAAESIRDTVHHQCAAILGELVVRGVPMAGEQIADRLGMTTHAVGKRLPDLERDGLIAKTRETHMNRSGRLAVKWVAC
jgi:predicted ArsR family transcriptional regulator